MCSINIKYILIILIFIFFISCNFKINNYKYLYPVKVNNKYGYIDEKGVMKIEPQFDFADYFYESFAIIKQNNHCKYINLKGEIVFGTLQFNACGRFSEKLASFAFEKNGKRGYINNKGEIVINPSFFEAYDFSESTALVVIDDKLYNRRFAYIDKNGKFVLLTKEVFPYQGNFKNDLAWVCSKSDKCGYINKKGEMVIPQEYNSASDFSEGLAAVSKYGKYGYINTKNKIIISEQFDDAKKFSEGLAAVGKGDLYGYINKRGKLIIPYKFIYAEEFLYGLAFVKEKVGKEIYEGYIDKKGKYVWKQKVEE